MDFKNLDFYLKLIYDANTKAIRFIPVTSIDEDDIGDVATLDEVLSKIYDPSTNALRISITGGDNLKQANDKIISTGALAYPISFLPRGSVAVTEKGGSRVDPDDIGGITITEVAGVVYVNFGSAPPIGQTLFIDYIY